VDEVWAETQQFWSSATQRARTRHRDPKYQMGLVFRWYSEIERWAIEGESGRVLDYQIWCGPSMEPSTAGGW